MAKDGDDGNLWVWAKKQTQGRGRGGRSWESMPGNLCASVFLKIHCTMNVVAQLSLVSGLAAYDALAQVCGDRIMEKIRLKWPNDLLLEDAKLGGILLESYPIPAENCIGVVIGTGLNVGWKPEIEGRKTTSLIEHDQVVSPDVLLSALAQTTANWLSLWENGREFTQIRERWALYGQKSGEAIEVHFRDQRIAGNFAGLNDDGGMILVTNSGEYKNVHFGDVFLPGEMNIKV